MATTTIPTQIIDFNIYNAPNKLIGAGDEVTLPKIVSKTYTAALAGGDSDLPGLTTENMEMEVPFNVFDKEAASTMSISKVNTLIIRSCQQKADTKTHNLSYDGLKLTIRGFTKEVDLGTLKRSDKMDSKITMTLTYIKIEDSSTVFLEIDKFNGTFIVNGKDVREGINKYL